MSRYIDITEYKSTWLVVCLHGLTLNTERHVSIVETLNSHSEQERAPALLKDTHTHTHACLLQYPDQFLHTECTGQMRERDKVQSRVTAFPLICTHLLLHKNLDLWWINPQSCFYKKKNWHTVIHSYSSQQKRFKYSS